MQLVNGDGLNKIKMPNLQNKQYINCLTYGADMGGCHFYRLLCPHLCIRSFTDRIVNHTSMKFILDERYFKDIHMVQCQRFVSDGQTHYLNNFLKPLSKTYGFWIVYEVDDMIYGPDIPPYNKGKSAYMDEKNLKNIEQNLNTVDFITTTTEELKNALIEKFNIKNPDKVLVIPNYLPRWWIGETYDTNRIKKRFQRNLRKHKIVLPLSLSHYDVEGRNNYIDDVTHITDFIRATCNKYEWTFLGGAYPKQLEDLVKDGKVKYRLGSDIFNYPREMFSIGQYDAIVAPLQDNLFNRCKSNIKLLEGWALGIPVIAQDLPTYSKYTNMTFKDSNQLQNRLDELFATQKHYVKVVEHYRNIVDYGDGNSKLGWWMEKNLFRWMNLFTIPKKTIELDFQIFEAMKNDKPVLNM